MPSQKKKARIPPAEENVSLEFAMEELTGIVSELESGQQSLSNALEKFERGMRLLKNCSQQLEDAAGRIEIVRTMSEAGAEIEPFDATATASRIQTKSSDTGSENLF